MVRRIVALQRVLLSAERELTLGSPVGDSATRGSEPGMNSHVAFELVETQDDVRRFSGAVRNPELGERRPVGDDLGDGAGGILQSKHVNDSAVAQSSKYRFFHSSLRRILVFPLDRRRNQNARS